LLAAALNAQGFYARNKTQTLNDSHIHLQRRNKRLLRNVDLAELAHLAFLSASPVDCVYA
jgi:hypothetical protein